MGMVIYVFRNEIKLNKYIAIINLSLLILLTWMGYYRFVFIFFGTYIIFYLGLGIKKYFRAFQENGDFSYGMYIYAFPVQQLVSFLLKNIGPAVNFFVSLPITFLLAVLSWYLIERTFLRQKNIEIHVVQKYDNTAKTPVEYPLTQLSF